MNYFTFLSKTTPQTTGYKVSREAEWDFRNRGACRWGTVYQTYGDSNVQHSADVPVSHELLGDFLGSLACELAQADDSRRAEMLEVIAQQWPRMQNSRTTIRFALSLKCKESKTTYYNVGERKTSTAESKKHDRRWDAIRPYDTHVDGSIPSACGVLKTGDGYDLLHTIAAWREVMAVVEDDNDGYCPLNLWEHFKLAPDRRAAYQMEAAWSAVESFVRAYRTTQDAIRTTDGWTHSVENARPAASGTAVA